MRNLIKRLGAFLTGLAKSEPAVILGTVASAATVAASSLTGAGIKTWAEVVPFGISLLIRQFVSSPSTTGLHSSIVDILAEALRSEMMTNNPELQVNAAGTIKQIVSYVAQSGVKFIPAPAEAPVVAAVPDPEPTPTPSDDILPAPKVRKPRKKAAPKVAAAEAPTV